MAALSIPGVSVVIPTRDRIGTLEQTLTFLEGQELGRLEAEVVVVDNGSRDDTVARLRVREPQPSLPLRVHEQPRPGAGPARNLGVQVAHHPVVLFLGDDTAPAGSGLLAAHARLHAMRPEPGYGVLGLTVWAPGLEPTPLMRWIERGRQFDYGSLSRGTVPAKHLYTSHVSLKAQELRECGGFDERLPFLYEDIELGARLGERGFELDYHPELVVHHDHRIELTAWLEREQAVGRSGRRLNALRAGKPALAPTPAGPGWALQRMAGALLRRLPTELSWLPGPLRAGAYEVLCNAAYARGYRSRDGAA